MLYMKYVLLIVPVIREVQILNITILKKHILPVKM